MTSPYAILESTGGKPRELFRFVSGANVYTYTSQDTSVVYNAGAGNETYAPVTLKRDSVLSSSDASKLELEIGFGVEVPVTALFVNGVAPGPVSCNVWRYQEGATLTDPTQIVLIFSGVVAAAQWQNAEAMLIVTPAQRTLQQTIPIKRMQPQCNLATYSTGCTLLESAFSATGTVASIDVTGTIIGITMGATGQPVPYYSGGKLKVTGLPQGFIENHNNTSGTAVNVSLLVPIPGLTVGASVTLVAGDDRSLQTCTQKFNNVANFEGFGYLNPTDPWVVGIRTDSTYGAGG
jgi:uncharacterized phage protein (TIGR02218 family)